MTPTQQPLGGPTAAGATPLQMLPVPHVWCDGAELSRAALGSIGPIRVRQELSAPTVCVLDLDLSPEGPRPRRGSDIRIRLGESTVDLFVGEVVELTHHLRPDLSRRVTLRCFDRSHRLRQTGRIVAHLDRSVAELAGDLAGPHGLEVDADPDGPRWPRIIQQGESDLALLGRVIEEAGLAWRLIDRTLRIRRREPIEVLEAEWGRTLHEATVSSDATASVQQVRSLGWNPVDRAYFDVTADSAGFPPQGASTGERFADEPSPADGYRALVDRVFAGADHAEGAAQRVLDQRVAAEVTCRAVLQGDSRWQPGIALRLAGESDEVAGPYVLCAVEHLIDTASGYVCVVDSAPPPRAAEPTRSASTLCTLATVIAVDDPDLAGRVRVRFPTLADVESEWIPVISFGAGKDKGLLCQPDQGDTVAVLYAADDPGRGLVLGGVWAEHLPGESAGVTDQAVRRFGLATADGQRLLLDRDGDRLVISNGAGSRVELTADRVLLHAEADLTIAAPGRRLVLRADTIDFQRG